ncbi:coiled-coil domain-containing protein 77-like isoform X2 [Xenia sp. Carnegie-2017]|uniref:coiled-coil domain-containing protein 77-like isoform X2 n=1 Tax=Xenia sp. Carnegie-2017 TaxID=2897299 RepID=UPI001F0394D8|nr:coiled-coil domain-containing protein 77-like isoform X2 [Xenia sp. Carnegie-2017]
MADCYDENDEAISSLLPTINQRLGHLKPSRELLEFYRKKIAEYDGEYEEVSRKLEQYKCTYEEQHKMQWEMRQREDEIKELQKALSDMQVYLFQEREHVLRLYAENDRLKIREVEDRKKIQHLLTLSHPPGGEITYFRKKTSERPVVVKHAKHSKSKDRNLLEGRGPGGHKKEQTKQKLLETGNATEQERDQQTLLLQIESLQAQLEEQTKLSREEIDALQEDRRVRNEEYSASTERDQDKVKSLTEKLHKTQDLLYQSTKDFLELKYELRERERQWMMDRDRLVQEIEHFRKQVDVSGSSVLEATGMSVEPQVAQLQTIHSLKEQVQQSQKLADMYREQCIGLEDELGRVKEETDVGRELFKERNDKVSRRLALMNQRYAALEKRRALEVEGFKNDIKILRNKLKNVEKHLFKVTVDVPVDGDIDQEVLRNVHATTARSKYLVGELHQLKAKIYSLENDLRHCG